MGLDDPKKNPELDRFVMDVAKFSAHYEQYLIAVRTKDGTLVWRSSDKTWGIGAATRYLNSCDEQDRIDEQVQAQGRDDE